jgi:hypothetical protein
MFRVVPELVLSCNCSFNSNGFVRGARPFVSAKSVHEDVRKALRIALAPVEELGTGR